MKKRGKFKEFFVINGERYEFTIVQERYWWFFWRTVCKQLSRIG